MHVSVDSKLSPNLKLNSNVLSNLELKSVLGEGSYGKVFLAEDSKTGEQFAVKTYDKSTLNAEKIARVYFEASIMSELANKHILKMKKVTEDVDRVYIVTEYAKNGDLLEYVRSKKKLTENEAREIFTQILDALDYTHNNNIIHRDIKLENILLTDSNKILIGDWGFADYYSIGKKIKCSWGSLYYAAPEVCLSVEYTGPEIDIWALGVVLYALVVGRLPFSGESNSEVVANIVNGNFKVPSSISKHLATLIYGMIQPEPLHRFNMKEIREHIWLTAARASGSGSHVIKINSDDSEIVGVEIKRDKKKSNISNFFSKLKPKNSKTEVTENKVEEKKDKATRDETSIPARKRNKSENKNKRWSINVIGLKVDLTMGDTKPDAV